MNQERGEIDVAVLRKTIEGLQKAILKLADYIDIIFYHPENPDDSHHVLNEVKEMLDS